ncbi:peptidylprolyl isomerase, partial [bacterium]|nr:peptidylprolyl isomerase [bacterium]
MSRPDAKDVIYSFGDQQITIGDLLLTFQETHEFSEFELHLKKGDDQSSGNSLSPANISSVTQFLQSIAQEIAFEDVLAQDAKDIKLDQEESFQHAMEDSLRDELYQKVIIEDVLKKIKITESDIKKYYQQHREGLFLKNNTNVYKVRGIYIYLNQAGRTPAQARSKMEEAYQRLEDGESFASVSKRYSEAPANMRGIINPLPVGSAAAPIEEQLKVLSEGKYSPIFEYKNRLYIFELVEYVGPDYLEYNTVHDSIMLQLFDERRNERVYDFSQRLKRKHNCLVNADLLKTPDSEDQDAIIMAAPGAFEITLG